MRENRAALYMLNVLGQLLLYDIPSGEDGREPDKGLRTMI